MMTADVLKESGTPLRVLVSEPVRKTNVEKFVLSQKKKMTANEISDGFELVIE